MHSYFRIPLIFFFIATSLGLLLRWHFIAPLDTIQYPFLLHAHSHIMFLGWVFNAFYLAFVYCYSRTRWIPRYRSMFIVLQVLVLAMLVSFPLQGYGVFSIVFSTLHTVVAVVFTLRFLKDLQLVTPENSVSKRFVQLSLVFFLVSGLGPFALGFVAANGLGHSNWYSFAVYFYLHFQYNGFFLFGVLGLFFKLLEERKIPVRQSMAMRAADLMAVACVPAYFLSVLWADPGLIFNSLGFFASCLQILSIILLIRIIHQHQTAIKAAFNAFSVVVLCIILISLITKIVLQLLSAFPLIAHLSLAYRTYVIAYLHLVLVGIITLFLIVWFRENSFIDVKSSKPALLVFLTGLTGMELLLIATPSWSAMTGYSALTLEIAIFAFSTLLWISAAWFALSPQSSKEDEQS